MTEIWPKYSKTCKEAPQEALWTSPGVCLRGLSGSKVILEPHSVRGSLPLVAAGLCWWVGPKIVIVAVVAAVSGTRGSFLPEIYLTGFGVSAGPQSTSLVPNST